MVSVRFLSTSRFQELEQNIFEDHTPLSLVSSSPSDFLNALAIYGMEAHLLHQHTSVLHEFEHLQWQTRPP